MSLFEVDQNGQNGPNRTEVVLMDRIRPKWYRTKMHQIWPSWTEVDRMDQCRPNITKLDRIELEYTE